MNQTNFTASNLNITGGDLAALELLSSPARLSLVILYSVTAIIAIAANLAVIIVGSYGRCMEANLHKSLVNLALGHLLFGVFVVPFTYTDFLYGQWIVFPSLCQWSQVFQILSIYITALLLTLISVERYLVILYPQSTRTKWITKRYSSILVVAWILAYGWASTPQNKIVTFTWNNETYLDCRPDYELYHSGWYNIVSAILVLVLPTAVQMYCYICIICWLHLKSTSSVSLESQRLNRDMMKTIRILIASGVVFLVCWIPIKIFMVLLTFEWPGKSFYIDYIVAHIIEIYFTCHWIAMASSFSFPVIYLVMWQKFRIDLRELIGKICTGNGKASFVPDATMGGNANCGENSLLNSG